ncbi:hypothetical protein [Emticicia sp. W12TSBA100-4]|uniref:hypothetical protein n=1 Tax=Emticicia sp. W12TSBA100-4 TaxID=3160965 RepID=UPI0033060F71
MEAKSTNRKTFQLTENGQLLGELIYESIVSLKAEIKLPNSDIYGIEHIGIFDTSINVTKNGAEIAKLAMNWRGQIEFNFHDGQEFILKAKGFLGNKFVLENKNEEKLIQFDPQLNWNKLNYNYDITFDNKPQTILLVLLGVYAANYFMASMSGAMA